MSSSHNETIIRDVKRNSNSIKGTFGNIYSTDMDDTVSIFGGADHLKDKIQMAVKDGYKVVFVVTTCISGIIGDNSEDMVEQFRRDNPDTEFFLVEADGNIMGDYKDGFVSCVERVVKMIDPSVEPDNKLINLVGTSFFKLRRKSNIKALEEIIESFGIGINCRFIDDCSLDEVRNFCRGSLDLLISDDIEGREMERIISERTGGRKSLIIPAGLDETKDFIIEMGRMLDQEANARGIADDLEMRYNEEIDSYRKILRGKRAIVICDPYANIDWNIDLLNDLGMEILKIGLNETKRHRGLPFGSRYSELTEDNYNINKLRDDIERLDPDIVIGDVVQIADLETRWIFLMKKDIGVDAPLDYARRMANIVRLPKVEGWRGELDADTA